MTRHTRFLERAGLLLLILGILSIVGVYFKGPENRVSATLNYQDPVTLTFNLRSIIDMSVNSNEYTIGSLMPGTSANSNTVIVTVNTNNSAGYTLRAAVGSDTNNSNQLRLNGTDTSNYFACASSLSADKWVFATSTNNSTWTNQSCLPLYSSGNYAVIRTASGPVTEEKTYTRVSAQASGSKLEGTYTNKINFWVVAST